MELGRRETLPSPTSKFKEIYTSLYAHESEDETIVLPPVILADANEGDETAQLESEKIFIDASSTQKNCDMTSNWISRSAEQGSMDAQFSLGDLYALGHGTSKNPSAAYHWYTKAAIQGYKKALIRLHNLYQEDIKIHCRGQIDSDEDTWADDNFKLENDIRELNEYRLEQKKSILNNVISYYTEQFKIYQSSDQEDPGVQLNLAFLYQHGYGIKKCTRWAFEYYQMAAEQGNTDAQFNLGDLYRKHTDMKFNYRHAFKWLAKSAQGGNRIAQRCLAYFYLKGLATDIDYDMAFSWYTKAAEAGDTAAMVALGKLYRKGDYIKDDLPMAVHWYTLAAQQGNIVAQNCISQLHQRGMLDNIQLEGGMLDYLTQTSMNRRLCTKLSTDISKIGDSSNLKQLNELVKRALIGDGQAMYEIGLKYLKGDDDFLQDEDAGMKWIKHAAVAKHKGARLFIAKVYKKVDFSKQDYHKAAIWYKIIAKKKDAVSQYNIGVMYNEGLGVRKDPLEASKWFIWAADQGNSDGQFCLSELKSQGRGIRRDVKDEFALLYDSALKGNSRSCYALGKKYITGDVEVKHEKDTKLGLSLFKFAAKNGVVPAQLDLALKYKNGDGVEKDIELCIQYYTMASDTGNSEADYELGLIYLNGDGVGHDYVKAYHFFKQANERGHDKAKLLFLYTDEDCWYSCGYSEVKDMFIKAAEQGTDDGLYYHIGSIYDNNLEPTEESFSEARKWFIIASNKGDPRADYRLGLIYECGHYIEKNMNEAIRYYERASRNGNADANFRLACLYLSGSKVTQDLSKAFHYYEMASTLGHKAASAALTVSKDGRGILDHPACRSNEMSEFMINITEKARLAMLENATDKGFTRLQYQLAVWYEKEYGYERALKWLILATEIGVTDAYYRLGTMYEYGRDVEQDYKMAAEMYHKAIEKEHGDACYRLGQLYQYGNGVKLDYLKAYQCYKKAEDMGHVEACEALNITLEFNADLNGSTWRHTLNPSSQEYQDSLAMFAYVAEYGDTEAQFKVGFAYEYCILEPNHFEAYKWYSLAAKESHREAIYHLGLLYEKGLGTSQNYQRAIQLYEQASQLGSDSALYQLGLVYHHGNGVKIDSIKAIEYYTLSANLGNPKYQCQLGKLYEEGEFVQKNLLEALKWYTRAYLLGYDNISSKLYSMDKYQPYNDFFFKKRFQNMSIASLGQFRLTDKYDEDSYRDLNNRLGIFCALGYGTDEDGRKAWDYFTKKYYRCDDAFEIKDIFSFEYGLNPMEIVNIPKAIEKDEACMNQINEEGLYFFGQYFLYGVVEGGGSDCFDGMIGGKDFYTSIDDYNGIQLSQHIKVEKDHSRAFKCLKLSTDKGYPAASVLLGIMYHCGNDFDQVKKEGEMRVDNVKNSGFKAMEHAAMPSQIYEGNKDFKKAFEWYTRALCDLDNFSDQIQHKKLNETIQAGLGLLYEYGDGVEKDYQEALERYNNLADNDHPIGYYRLALMYYYGKGVSVDYQKSFDLLTKATYQNSTYFTDEKLPMVYEQNQLDGNDSQNNRVYCVVFCRNIKGDVYYWLGLLYKNGQGVSQDHDTALKFFKNALDYKCKRAKYEIDGYRSNK